MRRLLIAMALACLAAGPLSAQADFSGTWDIEADYAAALQDVQIQCLYEGTAEITGTTGPVDLTLVGTTPAGNEDLCESSFGGTATIDGVMGDQISGTISSTDVNDPNGLASFTGTVANTSAPSQLQSSISGGRLNVTGGIFQGFVANFQAALQQPVPALTPLAFGLLLMVLVGGGGYLLLRRHEGHSTR